MKNGVLVVLLGLAIFSGGCATAMRGDKQKVKISTDPEGAVLTLNGTETFTTPAEVPLKRKDTQRFTLTKDGYRTVTFNLSANWDGLSMTSFVLPGGSVLFGIDTASGADRSFNKLATIKLEKMTTGQVALELFEHRGTFYTREDFDRVVLTESQDKTRFMGSSSD